MIEMRALHHTGATLDFIKKVLHFLKSVVEDERIPSRDKKVLLTLIALIVSPIDLIPDWIPILGLVDDLVILALVLDYFFEVLDRDILLSHYPWGMKSFAFIRRSSRIVSQLAPGFVKKLLWKYEGSPYKKL